MQLNSLNCRADAESRIVTLLSVATCTLLTAAPAIAAEAVSTQAWHVDVGAMNYAEEDRIRVHEGTIRLRRQLDEDRSLTVRASYDSVSGSSPTGAVKIHSRSGASGTGYVARFETERTGIGADWDTALTEKTHLTITADHSTQPSYDSTGVGATLARDFNQRNTTVTAGIGFSQDLVKPKSGLHYGMGSVAANDVWHNDDTKEQLDLQLGITQVLARGTLFQLNYVRSRAAGYMTNPYKIISIVNETTGSTGDYDSVFENRPRTRDMNALYAQLNQSVGKGVAYISYRYFQDDWDIRAHTFDVKYRRPLGERLFVQPHVRYYQQTAANFYRSMLTNTEASNLPQYASADYRLAELHTTSVGIKIGYRQQAGGEFSARMEVVRQQGEDRPWDAVGIQRENGVFPELKATIFNVTYTVPF